MLGSAKFRETYGRFCAVLFLGAIRLLPFSTQPSPCFLRFVELYRVSLSNELCARTLSIFPLNMSNEERATGCLGCI